MADRQIPWARIFIEGVVIVGSILLAFGIQAAWDERQERRAEAEYLLAIQGELEENLDAVGDNLRVSEMGYEALQRAERLLLSEGYADSAVAFVESLVRGSSGSGGPRLSTAVFEELTSSGRIVVIEDLTIRRRVLQVYAQVAVNIQRSDRRTDDIDSRLSSLIAGHVPPGIIQRSEIFGSIDRSRITDDALRSLAMSIASEAALAFSLRAAMQERENQRRYRRIIQDRLMTARDELATHLES